MPTMQNPYGYATPVGASLGRLAQAFASGPSKYEVEHRQAATEAAQLLAQERQQKIEMGKRKMAATGRLGQLFNQATVGELPLTTLQEGEMGPPAPMTRGSYARSVIPQMVSEGLNAELNPDQIGQLGFQMMKLGGATDADIAAAYPKLIGVNDAVSLADRENVAARNQKGKIAEIFATPVSTAAGATTTFGAGDSRKTVTGMDTDSTAQAKIVNRIAGGETNIPTAALSIVGATDKAPHPNAPKNGVTNIRNWVAPGPNNTQLTGRTLDGATDMTTGEKLPSVAQVFTGQVNATDTGGLTRAVKTDLQKNEVAMGRFRSLLDQTVEMAKKDAMNFGLPGFVKGGAQDIKAMSQGVTTALGFKTPDEALQNARRRLIEDGVDPGLLSGIFDPNLPALNTMADLLVFSAAEALAGQQGRGISDRDVATFKKIVGDPTDLTMNQEKFLAKMSTLGDIVGGREAADQAIKDGAPAPAPKPSTKPTARIRIDTEGNVVK